MVLRGHVEEQGAVTEQTVRTALRVTFGRDLWTVPYGETDSVTHEVLFATYWRRAQRGLGVGLPPCDRRRDDARGGAA